MGCGQTCRPDSRWEIRLVADGAYTLKALCCDTYLNALGGEGNNVHMWDNPDSNHSQWEIQSMTSQETQDVIHAGTYTIKNVNSAKYLTVKGHSADNGGNVEIWDNPNDPAAQWKITWTLTGNMYTLMNVGSGKYLNEVTPRSQP